MSASGGRGREGYELGREDRGEKREGKGKG